MDDDFDDLLDATVDLIMAWYPTKFYGSVCFVTHVAKTKYSLKLPKGSKVMKAASTVSKVQNSMDQIQPELPILSDSRFEALMPTTDDHISKHSGMPFACRITNNILEITPSPDTEYLITINYEYDEASHLEKDPRDAYWEQRDK